MKIKKKKAARMDWSCDLLQTYCLKLIENLQLIYLRLFKMLQ